MSKRKILWEHKLCGMYTLPCPSGLASFSGGIIPPANLAHMHGVSRFLGCGVELNNSNDLDSKQQSSWFSGYSIYVLNKIK
jgi:hypothetical protein